MRQNEFAKIYISVKYLIFEIARDERLKALFDLSLYLSFLYQHTDSGVKTPVYVTILKQFSSHNFKRAALLLLSLDLRRRRYIERSTARLQKRESSRKLYLQLTYAADAILLML